MFLLILRRNREKTWARLFTSLLNFLELARIFNSTVFVTFQWGFLFIYSFLQLISTSTDFKLHKQYLKTHLSKRNKSNNPTQKLKLETNATRAVKTESSENVEVVKEWRLEREWLGSVSCLIGKTEFWPRIIWNYLVIFGSNWFVYTAKLQLW